MPVPKPTTSHGGSCARSAWVAQPRLERPVVTEVAGRVEAVDYLAAKDSVRLTVHPTDPALPPKVRISVDEKDLPAGIAAGAEVRARARLAPPPPMALPGTYDFARDAWFRGLGAVGKTLGPVTVTRPSELLDAVLAAGRKGLSIQRYKGLGEMNAEQLWETTLDPSNRSLLRVEVAQADVADEIFTRLMGDVVEPRREFIQDNSLTANVDV